MADLTTVEIPWTDSDFKCPICGDRVEVKVRLNIKSARARHSGTESYNKPVISTTVESEADGAIISHNCSKKAKTHG